jgi:sec-independent protein translocase protein TatC
MPFLDHLEELRGRILKSLITVVVLAFVAFPFTDMALDILTHPNTRLANPARLVFLKPTGMLMLRMEVAIALAVIVGAPIILYQLWQFIAPGLLERERKYVFPVIFLTVLCFLTGASFCYFALIPVILPFLFSMGTETIQATININEYMSFVLRLILLSGLTFELPVIAFALARIGLITPAMLRRIRRYAIVGIFIFAAVVTPPDPLSQIVLALPMLLLYEISIWVSALGHRKKKESDARWTDDVYGAASGRSEPAGPAHESETGSTGSENPVDSDPTAPGPLSTPPDRPSDAPTAGSAGDKPPEG